MAADLRQFMQLKNWCENRGGFVAQIVKPQILEVGLIRSAAVFLTQGVVLGASAYAGAYKGACRRPRCHGKDAPTKWPAG